MRLSGIILALVLMARFSSAMTIQVPGHAGTIQAGINLAKSGDTVLVADGIYSGDGNHEIHFNGKAVLLKSQHGSNAAIIDLTYDGSSLSRRGFYLDGIESPALVIDGFSIIHGGGFDLGGAIFISDCSPTFRNCHINDNHTPIGAGVYATGICSPKFYNCEFRRNSCSNVGAAVLVRMGASGYFEDCLIEGNYGSHGAFLCYNASPTVVNCRFENNNMANKGGAVFMQDNCSPSFTDCTFARNSGSHGGAIFIQERGMAGGQSSPVFTNCTIYGNSSIRGSAVYCDGYGGPSFPEFIRCLIAFNTADQAFNLREGDPQLSCTDIYGHPLGDWTGVIADQASTDGNFCLDPLFCDTTGNEFNIDATSPGTPVYNECDELIGAWPIGCNTVVIMAHLFIEPNPILQVYEASVNPMNFTLYCGSMEQNCDPHLIDTSTIMINGQKISTTAQAVATNQAYWGEILMVTCPATDFLSLYGFLWDTTLQPITVRAATNDGSMVRFEGHGTFIGRISGDANGDNAIDIGDPVHILKFLFNEGRPPQPLVAGDANGDATVDVGDAVYLINYIFRDGPRPVSAAAR
jgi:hypothetical protein